MGNFYNATRPQLNFAINAYGCSDCDITIDVHNTEKWEDLLISIAENYDVGKDIIEFLIEEVDQSADKSSFVYDSKKRLVTLALLEK